MNKLNQTNQVRITNLLLKSRGMKSWSKLYRQRNPKLHDAYRRCNCAVWVFCIFI